MPYVKVNGIQMYYEDIGEGLPVVFLHGMGSSHNDWELQIPYFKDDYRLIIPDMRGHGLTDKPPGKYSVPLFAEDVKGLLQALGIKQCAMVGISIGGMVAYQLATSIPEQLSKIAVVNSLPELIPRTWQERWQFQRRLFIIRWLGMKRIAEFIGRRLFPYPHQVQYQQALIQRFSQNDRSAYLRTIQGLVGWSVLKQLGKISCPVLVLCGDRDYFPVEMQQQYACKIADVQLQIVQDSGHATPIDQAEVFNQVVAKFLLTESKKK